MENAPNVVEQSIPQPAQPVVEKKKRQASEKQKENLAKGRAIRAANKEAKAKAVPDLPAKAPTPAPVQESFKWSEDIEDRIVNKMMTKISAVAEKQKEDRRNFLAEKKALLAKKEETKAEPKPEPKPEPKAEAPKPKEVPQPSPVTQSPAPAKSSAPIRKTGNKILDRLMSQSM